MSLINRMLKDLSSRTPASGNVMTGIQIQKPAPARRAPLWPRVGALLGIVAVFTAGLWWVYGPRSIPAPAPRAAASAGDSNSFSMTKSRTGMQDVTGTKSRTELQDVTGTPAAVPQEPVQKIAAAALERPNMSRFRLDMRLAQPPAAGGTQRLQTHAVSAGGGAAVASSSKAEQRYDRGRKAQQDGDAKAAERYYVEALTLDPGLHSAREALIALRLDQGRIADARRLLKLGLQIAPEHVPYQELAARLGTRASGSAPPASAVPEKSMPVNERSRRDAETRFAEGQRAMEHGEMRTAEQNFVDALASNPQLRSARVALISLLLDQQRLTEAQQRLSEAPPQDATDPALRRLGARLDLAHGQPEAALNRLDPSPPALSADPEYHGLLASVYQRLNRHADAARVYQGLMQEQPNEAHWWAGYGISKDALGETQEALKAYAQARQLGGLDARVLEYISRRVAALKEPG